MSAFSKPMASANNAIHNRQTRRVQASSTIDLETEAGEALMPILDLTDYECIVVMSALDVHKETCEKWLEEAKTHVPDYIPEWEARLDAINSVYEKALRS